MKAEEIAYFKSLLEDQLQELLRRAFLTVGGLLAEVDPSADLVDRASQDVEQNYTLRIRDRESRLIRKIQSALQRIEEDTYGICQQCGEDISIGRLKARPVTTLCIQCKTRMESLEKAIGM
jgi:DnaK suppressor protein